MRFFSILAILSLSFVAAEKLSQTQKEEAAAEEAEIAAQEKRRVDSASKNDVFRALFETKMREFEEFKSTLNTPIGKDFEPKLEGCTNNHGWTDSVGLTCKDYGQNPDWCAVASEYTNKNGKSAKDACCACGGGDPGYGKGVYYVKSLYSGEYLAIYKLFTPVRMSDNLWSPFIDIELVPLKDNYYALMSHKYGDRFISVNESGEVKTANQIGDWERFKIITASNGSVQFINVKWNRYLDAYKGVKTSMKSLGKYTTFNLLPAKTMDTSTDMTNTERKNLRG